MSDLPDQSGASAGAPESPRAAESGPDAADVITRFRETTEAANVDGFMGLIDPEAELISPVSGRLVIRGRTDLRTLFEVVYGTIEGLTWVDQITDGPRTMLRGEARIGPVRLDDAMVLELGADGRIVRIRPHFRPLLGLLTFALIVGTKLLRHPALFVRAARR